MSLLCKKNYVNKCFNETINSIRKHVENKIILLLMRPDVEGTYVVNVK